MDRKSKVLLGIMVLFLVFSVFAKYHKFSVAQDYYTSSEISCDTDTEACFVWDCDLTDEECDQTPYKYIWKYAANIPDCDPLTDECEELVCEDDEDDCEVIYCSEETLGEEEFCFNDAR